MTPAEIAKKLTPAQVRALRQLNGVSFAAAVSMMKLRDLGLWEWVTHGETLIERKHTDLGRAVLAELDKLEGKA